MTGSGRHLTRATLESYIDADVRAAVPIPGTPKTLLVIDPERGRLALHVAVASGETVTPTAYRRISVTNVIADGTAWAECSVDGLDLALEAYPVLCAIADRTQIDKLPFDKAVRDAVESFRAVVESLGVLSRQEQIGLIGELLILRNLLTARGASAINAWRGFLSEEHDFDLGACDIEVKTTAAERPRHWVSSMTQLLPSPHRDLWFVSIRLTTAAPGEGAYDLPGLIDSIRSSMDTEAAQLLDERLRLAHWDDGQAPLCHSTFRLRTAPSIFLVDAAFPAITSQLLAAARVPLASITRLTYQIDLSDVPEAQNPPTELLLPIEGGPSHA